MITVHINARADCPVPRELVRRAVLEALYREGVEAGELSVTFVGDGEISEMHARYLDSHTPTDVLSFRLHGEGEDPLGDVYVGHAQAMRQADEAGVEADEELARLAVHGVLHVLGYEHPEGPERTASEMYARQEGALAAAVDGMAATRAGTVGR
ncbi:MAG: rRNA maturation RNase YbeY [Gemmatimonadetes bacterium]|nr:rRNA maturation RNase YbeY [Gemmatimonadota bacterium]MCY3942547.1 rRNA maturation RNase YbeY [Gemmatimonadota bacterium]